MLDVVNETERMAELNSYRILDTARESQYEEITELASKLCNMPIAVITLLDDSRQWFKSKIGLDVSETPREWSFCHHAILQDTIMTVPNALEDVRFKDSPLVVNAPFFRSYAGVPLVTPAGVKLGTLCVIDVVPRLLGATEIWILERLASQVMAHLTARKDHYAFSDVAGSQRRHITALQSELSELDWLKGLVTVCSGCKNIKQEDGHWCEIEKFIQRNSKVEFSHSICPDCRTKLYPPLS